MFGMILNMSLIFYENVFSLLNTFFAVRVQSSSLIKHVLSLRKIYFFF